MPVLLQTLEVRLRRPEALRSREGGGLPPLKLIAVTHESTLRQVVGSPSIMRARLDELIERSAAANIYRAAHDALMRASLSEKDSRTLISSIRDTTFPEA